MGITQDKSLVRSTVLKLRDGITAEDRGRKSEEIAARTVEFLRSHNVRSIHCYLSFRSEVETLPLIGQLRSAGVEIVVPILHKTQGMLHAHFAEDDELVERGFGIREPLNVRFAGSERLQAVILPLAAFDRQGGRLGYGKGYYDTFLKTLLADTLRIGLAFASQEIRSVPREAHDEFLGVVITEDEVINCNKPGARLEDVNE